MIFVQFSQKLCCFPLKFKKLLQKEIACAIIDLQIIHERIAMSRFSFKINKRLAKMLAFGMVVLMLGSVLAGCSGCNGCSGCAPSGPDPNTTTGGKPGGVVFDPSQGDKPQDPEATGAPGVAIPGWATLTIPPNQKTVNCGFENPIANQGNYHLSFELRLIDPTKPNGYEALFTSGLVEAGKGIYEMTMTRGLPAGTYPAMVFVQPYYTDMTPTANNAQTAIQLIVK